ncbi:energy transducer TonB [Bacteroidota bacterium]
MRSIVISIFIMIFSGFLKAQTEEVNVPITKKSISYDSQPVFFIVEEMPIFSYIDCSESRDCFDRYIADSLRIPSVNCSGKVYVQFIVEPDSTVDNVKIIMGLKNCPGYEKEIERLFASMPKWVPGKQRGKAVRIVITAPIIFNTNQ